MKKSELIKESNLIGKAVKLKKMLGGFPSQQHPGGQLFKPGLTGKITNVHDKYAWVVLDDGEELGWISIKDDLDILNEEKYIQVKRILRKENIQRLNEFSVHPHGISNGLYYLDIDGHVYAYEPLDVPIKDLERKFLGMMKFSSGKALAWLKKHTILYGGSKKPPKEISMESVVRKLVKEEIKKLNEGDVYWRGPVRPKDDFGLAITDEFIDGKTKMGPWATMTPESFKKYGFGKLGMGLGQRYKKQADGKWLKVEG